MKNPTKRIAVISAVTCGFAAGGIALAPAMAQAATQASCRLYASAPSIAGSTISAAGGREGCANTATATLLIKRDLEWLPDNVMATVGRSGVTFTLSATASGAVQGNAYYTEVYSDQNSLVQSARVVKK